MIQNPSKLSLFFSRLTNKINKKVKIAFALLLLVALGMFLYNAYQRAYKPYLYDKNNYYYKVYNYSVKKIIPQRKVVKDIEIEVLHFGKDDFPDDLSAYKVGHYIDKGIDPRRLFLHITFTDNTNMTLPFGQVTSTENFFDRYERYFDRKVFEVGPGFDKEWFSNAENYRQIIQRFPGLHDKTMDANFELYLRDFLFLIVPGDTLYQTGAVKEGVSKYHFQLKNPKSGKMQSYFIYGNEGKIPLWDWQTPFVTFDKDFNEVIKNCKELRENKEGTWITNEIMEAYINLHKKGFATSVEVYKDQELVGGLYGVKIGKCFFGESMFSKKSNASKVALISICKKLEEEGYIFLDCQMHTNHLESMGGKFVSWKEFKVMLKEGLAL